MGAPPPPARARALAMGTELGARRWYNKLLDVRGQMN